jgi:hypothetical protein
MAGGQSATPTPEAPTMYIDPDRRFGVPIPTGWDVEVEEEGYVVLETVDNALSVSIAVVEAATAEEGLAEAWKVVRPDFDATVPEGGLQAPPVGEGVDESVLATYDDGSESGRFVQAWGQRIGDNVYVLILRGDLEAARLRGVQIRIIQDGFRIGELVRGGTPQPDGTPAA